MFALHASQSLLPAVPGNQRPLRPRSLLQRQSWQRSHRVQCYLFVFIKVIPQFGGYVHNEASPGTQRYQPNLEVSRTRLNNISLACTMV